jgi:hypothetical protein
MNTIEQFCDTAFGQNRPTQNDLPRRTKGMKRRLMFFWLLIFCRMNVFAAPQSPHSSQGHLEVQRAGNVWKYTAVNEEAPGSPNHITGFNLGINAPVDSIEAPAGWKYSTDNASYIQWFVDMPSDAGNPATLSKEAVAPKSRLTGFVVRSKVRISASQPYNCMFWDYAKDQPAVPSDRASIESPSK